MTKFHNRRTAWPVLAGMLATTALLATSALPAFADGDKPMVVAVDEITFTDGPPTLPQGAQIAVLQGHPGKEGAFVIRLKFPGGYNIPPHRHPEEEHVTVISGGFGMSVGDVHDRSAAGLLAPGGFVRIPAGQPHYAWSDAETVVQINAMGPFGIEYIDTKDDPRIK
uniref:cupin domain-containing protein n=1 Tax=Pararhizobium sp. IMCC3301 TaxID=3067904 RepID=UPI002742457B|nr:cupin domain-containing protein [Pararhizobium sp. IMCC3301]